MGTIAKGEITLSPVNDAYTVLLTPASCVINADYDGSNPRLQNATTTLTIKRGTKTVPFSILGIAKSSADVGVSFSTAQTTSAPLKLLGVSHNDLSGWVDVTFRTADGFDYTSTVRFNFTIVRETSMLDWILDWEGSKTKVGGTYIMTPKLFVGHKESVVHTVEQETADSYEEVYEWTEDAITGVYLGPDLLDKKQTVGLYGYYLSKEIFHLNAEGGMIGGWDINEAGISSGNLKILSEGSIIASSPTKTFWALYANGNASFANGNVVFKPNGDASFAGHIESISGKIGGWTIVSHQLHNGRIILDSTAGLIGVYAGLLPLEVTTGVVAAAKVPSQGGVTLYYTSSSDFGLIGCSTTSIVFRLGSTNFIAGWSFDDQAIYIGTKNTTQHAFTEADSLTISPTGLRSNKWYIDRDGTAKFVGGSVFFDTDKAEMFGWKMRDGRFSSAHAALISNSYWSGVFVSPADLTEIAALSLTQTIHNNGGIYMYSDGANSVMRAYDKNGNVGFALQTNGYHTIGSWNFNHQTIYTGSYTPDTSTKFMSESNQMVLSTSIGLIGHKWALRADGSGAIAGGHISWNTNGDIKLDDGVKIEWANVTGTSGITDKLTKITSEGIYTGEIQASQIKALKIDVSMITNVDSILSNGNHWGLLQDGSGYLANKNISWQTDGSGAIAGGKITWDKNGNMTISGEFTGVTGVFLGCVYSPYRDYTGSVIAVLSKEGTNLCVRSYLQQGIVLPSDLEYEGVECEILMGYDGQATIRVMNDLPIYYWNKGFSMVSLHGLYNKVRLKAFQMQGMHSVCWYIVNTQDFEYSELSGSSSKILHSKLWT